MENVSRSNCAVCLEDIHHSRIPCHIPTCGHLLHRTCFEQLLVSGHYACPTCQTSMLDMKQLWNYLDNEIQVTPMPKEYENFFVDILCKDCHLVSHITTARSSTLAKRSLISRSRQFSSTSLDSSAKTATAAGTTRLEHRSASTARSPRQAQHQMTALIPTTHLPALPTLKTTLPDVELRLASRTSYLHSPVFRKSATETCSA